MPNNSGIYGLIQSQAASHHHIHTEDGWMTARQAADRGQGTLLTNQVHPRVYSLCLEGGGNIIIDTTATLQNAPIQIEAATKGCRFEPSTDPQHKGSLTYPDSIRAGMGQIKGMETGRKHSRSNEVETEPNGGLRFRNIPDIKRDDSPTLDFSPRKERLGTTLGPLMRGYGHYVTFLLPFWNAQRSLVYGAKKHPLNILRFFKKSSSDKCPPDRPRDQSWY